MPDNFYTIREMKSESFDWNKIPDSKGIYVVRRKQTVKPVFIPPNKGSGGWFKKKNPNVQLERLEKKWINFKQGEDRILYIGQAGGGKSNSTLRRRVRQYIQFGQGLPVGHWGGRFIWQLVDSNDLEIHWETNEVPLEAEEEMLIKFKKNHEQQLPFANLRM